MFPKTRPRYPVNFDRSLNISSSTISGVQILSEIVKGDDIDDFSSVDGRDSRSLMKLYTDSHSAACGVTSLKQGEQYLIGKNSRY